MRETLWQEFAHSLRLHRHRTALRMGDDALTYAELDDWSLAVAAQLADAGVRTGDRVALYLRNSVEFVATDLAIARLGAVKVPINYMLPVHTVRYIVESCGAKAVVFSTALGDPVGAAGPARLAVGPPAPDDVSPLTGRGAPGRPLDAGPGPDGSSVAAIYYTAGTTGKPKGVVHSQRSTVAMLYAQILEAEIAESDRLLLMTPLAHAAGLFTQSALIRGASIVLTDGFDAGETVRLLDRHAITWTFLVPTMIYRILDTLDAARSNGTALRTVVYGASPISPTRLDRALDVFGPVFIQLYGQTECPNWGTRLTKSDHDPARPKLLTSCGQASIMADVRIVDDHGANLPPNEVGEICLRSPYTLDRYLDDADATRAKFLDSWIRTGDIGTMDDDGYIYLKDRKNDMIITGGMNVYGREVEDVLSAHPDVASVAVIGVPHSDWGESVHAVVVARNSGITAEQLLAWARPKLSGYAAPKSVEFVDNLPETAFGKIDKRALRAPYWADASRAIN
jgi:fatty-acyl-CoA synthase/long-chain acyl-CoA synthetase